MSDFLVLARILVLLPFNVHFVATLANILALAQVINKCETFPRLAPGLSDDFFNFRIILKPKSNHAPTNVNLKTYRTDEQFGTKETNASQYFDSLCEKANMKNRLSEINVSKMARTFAHVPSACLASRHSVHDTLPRVHETAHLRASPFISLWIFYSSFSH